MKRLPSSSIGVLIGIACCAEFGLAQATNIPAPPSQDSRAISVDDWHCAMANEKTEIRFRDESNGKNNDISWKLMKDHRTLARGRANCVKENDRHELVIRFEIKDAPVQSVLELELQLEFGDRTVTHPVFLFPEDPFDDQQTALKDAEVHLFDPAGDTVTIFEAANIPFIRLRRHESIDDVENGLVIIGEGLPLRRHARLAESLSSAASRGVNIVWLAPDEGTIEFGLGWQNRIVFQTESVVKRFDRRFDARSWAGTAAVKRRWEVDQSGYRLSLKSSDSLAGWPWVEFRYQHPQTDEPKHSKRPESAFVVCGFGIVSGWNDGPVARHLLWNMIVELSQQKTSNKK